MGQSEAGRAREVWLMFVVFLFLSISKGRRDAFRGDLLFCHHVSRNIALPNFLIKGAYIGWGDNRRSARQFRWLIPRGGCQACRACNAQEIEICDRLCKLSHSNRGKYGEVQRRPARRSFGAGIGPQATLGNTHGCCHGDEYRVEDEIPRRRGAGFRSQLGPAIRRRSSATTVTLAPDAMA